MSSRETTLIVTTYRFSTEFMQRLRDFLSSPQFSDLAPHSKSEYWQHNAAQVEMRISNDTVTIGGNSGFYIPPERFSPRYMAEKALKVAREPSLLVTHIKRRLGFPRPPIRLLSYFEAFDAVMGHDPVADPDLSEFRLNFLNLRSEPGIMSSVQEIVDRHSQDDHYEVDQHTVRMYYYLNILHSKLRLADVGRVVEIGAGSGNLLALFHRLPGRTTLFNVDLPETMLYAILYLSDLFPDARMLLPNEVPTAVDDLTDYDFVFLTPNQTESIETDTIDLAINIDSFQEMTQRQISEYFDLVHRCARPDSFFFTSNRVEKIPCGPTSFDEVSVEPPNRFSEYPWRPESDVLVHEICRLTRLVQLDNAYIHLEQVRS